MKKLKSKYFKRIIILLISILLLKTISYNLYKYFVVDKIAENAFYKYLNSKNINKEEINKLNIYYDSKGGNGYFIEVIYNNELNLIYEYFYNISKSNLNYSRITDKGGMDITMYKEITPLYEDKNMVLKYTLFDYFKDIKVSYDISKK